MFDYATAAVEGALAAGAEYADARVVVARTRMLAALNGNVEALDQNESAGVGVRALIGSSWGFFAVSDLAGAAARRAGEQAAEIARASAMVAGEPLPLADVPVRTDRYSTPHQEDPFSLSLAEQADLLVGVTATMKAVPGVALGRALLWAWATDKYFVSSQGHRLEQNLLECGGGMDATAIGEHETQRRSYPQSFGQFETGGYEVVRRFDLPGEAGRVAEDAVALLGAPECPEVTTDLVLESSQVALQIHESVGHAIELDRILGWEAAFAGTSFLDLSRLGSLRYGSPLMNITADATLPGALGTFCYDDEGTPAQRVDIVREGRWVGVLSGRDSAAVAGLPPRRHGAGGRLRPPADGADDERGPRARRLLAGRDSRRFANSFIHQNVAGEDGSVSVKVALRGRVASSSTTRTDADGLAQLVDGALAAAALRPVDPEWPGLTAAAPVPAVDHHDAATEAATAAERAERVAAFVSAGRSGADTGRAGPELRAAGFCDTAGSRVAFANSAGQRAEGRSSRATLGGIHQSGDAAGSAHQTSSRFADLDVAARGAEAADRTRRSSEPVTLEPGEYEVVLEPECVASIVEFLCLYGYNAKQVLDGRSGIRLDEQQFDPAVSLWDVCVPSVHLAVFRFTGGARG